MPGDSRESNTGFPGSALSKSRQICANLLRSLPGDGSAEACFEAFGSFMGHFPRRNVLRATIGSHFGSSMRIALILLKLIGSVTGSSGSLAAH